MPVNVSPGLEKSVPVILFREPRCDVVADTLLNGIYMTSWFRYTFVLSLAGLIALPAWNDSRLENISTRALIQTGDGVLIGGVIISGTEPKTILIRARGPSITQFGVPDVLANPVLELHSGSELLETNDRSADHPRIGEVPVSDRPTFPEEAAIIATLEPGPYTTIVRGVGETSGVGIVEVFELTATGAARLANVSSRAFVSVDDDVMIGGFAIAGTSDATVLVRARGPSLAGFGVSGELKDPWVQLFAGDELVDPNDNWMQHPDWEEIPLSLRPDYDNESALVATLAPGLYTAIVRGTALQTGVGIVEAFELVGTRLSGSAQKGPFDHNSPLTAIVRRANGETTGRQIDSALADDLGRFSVPVPPGAELVELVVQGFYRDETTGQLSPESATLGAVVALTGADEQSTNINILTHLVGDRIIALLNEGTEYDTAREQAEGELLATMQSVIPSSNDANFGALSLYGDEGNPASPYLLAVSSIVSQYLVSDTSISSADALLEQIAADFADGSIEPVLSSELQAAVALIDPLTVNANMQAFVAADSSLQTADVNVALDTDLDGVVNLIDTDDDNDGDGDGIEDDADDSPYARSFQVVADRLLDVDEDQSVEIDVSANDPSGVGTLVIQTDTPNSGLVSGGYPLLTYAPSADFNGIDVFSYVLEQGDIRSSEVTVTVNVHSVNDVPAISGDPLNQATAGQTYEFTPAANDVDGEGLTFSVTNLPAWATFDTATGQITGTPVNDDVGEYSDITISVSDAVADISLAPFQIAVAGTPWVELAPMLTA